MSNTDVFSRAGQDFGGAIAADAAQATFSSAGGGLGGSVGMLVQQLGINYQQQVTRIFEIGTESTYYVVGRTQGQVDLARVLGPRAVQLAFYTKFGNACNAATNNINFMADTGCPGAAGSGGSGFSNGTYSFTVMYAVIIQLGITINSQDMIINEKVGMMFAALDPGQGSSTGA